MATDIMGSIPAFKVPNMQITPAMLNLLIMAMIMAVIFFVMMKLRQNRVYVDLYEKVKSGYVSKPGRYRITYDKTTKMHSLVPMFGKERIPAFKSEHFQKVGGMPFVGVLRQIKLIKVNKHTYYPVLPPVDKTMIGDVKDFNSLTWVRTEILKAFDKKVNSGQLLYILSVAAPCVVIISAIVFLLIAMYTDQYLLQTLVGRIDEISQALIAVVGKGG